MTTQDQNGSPAEIEPQAAAKAVVSYIGDLGAKREFLEAFTKAQGEFGEIENNCTAHVRPKDRTKAGYSFKYADLAEIIRKTRPALSKNGLALSQTVRTLDNGDTVLDTLLEHVGGCGKISTVPLPTPGSVDDETFASTLSRFRRYLQQSMLNVSGADPEQAPPADDGDWPPHSFPPIDDDHFYPATPAPAREEPPRKPRAAVPTTTAAPEQAMLQSPAHIEPPALPRATVEPPALPRATVEPQADDDTPASAGERNFLLAKVRSSGADLAALIRSLGFELDAATLAGMTRGQFRALKGRLPL